MRYEQTKRGTEYPDTLTLMVNGKSETFTGYVDSSDRPTYSNYKEDSPCTIRIFNHRPSSGNRGTFDDYTATVHLNAKIWGHDFNVSGDLFEDPQLALNSALEQLTNLIVNVNASAKLLGLDTAAK